MTAIVLNLQPLIQLTPDQFHTLCQANPEAKLERTSSGELVVMPSTDGESGSRNRKLTQRLGIWTDQDGTGEAFDSSTMFQLPNGAFRSPDAAWVRLDRWTALTPEARRTFPPLCPDFVVELRSETDSLRSLQDKLQEYLDNGARLGWLLDPKGQQVEIYRPGQPKQVLAAATQLSGEEVLPGFTLNLPGIL
jgi:Uma2 family endonuclease